MEATAMKPGLIPDERLEEIRQRHAAMIDGPYRWDMWDSGTIHLRAVDAPGYIVMQFGRRGLHGAMPMFNDRQHHIMRRADVYARQRYPHHVGYDLDVDHPDAQGLAHSWQDVDDLLRLADSQRERIAELESILADYRT